MSNKNFNFFKTLQSWKSIFAIASIFLVIIEISPNTLFAEQSANYISYKAGSCFGSCSNFWIKIRESGEGTFVGYYFVTKEGMQKVKFSKEDTERLFAEFADSNLFDLSDNYDSKINDIQENEIEYKYVDKTKRIRFSGKIPEQIKKLQERILGMCREKGLIPVEKVN